MILLFTDFGHEGFYVGQMKAAILAEHPHAVLVDLMHDAPAFAPEAAGRLLAALAPFQPAGSVTVAVVDPGVGGARPPVAVLADGRWFVGPDNGLFGAVIARAASAQTFRIAWRPARLSASFHGRDLFAPTAARIASALAAGADNAAAAGASGLEPCSPKEAGGGAGAADLAQVICIDRYGNAMTGLDAASLPAGCRLAAGGEVFARARTFSDMPAGAGFWYENSVGLAEIAVNRGSAAARYGLEVGSPVQAV